MIFLPNLIPNKIEPKIILYLLVVNSANPSDYYRIIASTLRKYLSDNESRWLWNKITIELEKLSKIVENRLRNYNKPAKGLAIAIDFDLVNCLRTIAQILMCVMSVYSYVASICPLCVQVVTCIPACATVFTAWTCLLCIGTGLAGCLACIVPLGFCTWLYGDYLQYCT